MNKPDENRSLLNEGEAGAAEQHYSLKWNDYAQKLVSAVQSLRENEDFVDVTLACDGNQYVAHKVILASCSPYFRTLLKANPCKHPVVLLKDVGATELEHLLEFMYNGEVNIAQENLAAFLKTAESLRIRGLAGNSDEQTNDEKVNSEQQVKRSATRMLGASSVPDRSAASSPSSKRRRLVQADASVPKCQDIQFKSEPYDDIPLENEPQFHSPDADSSTNRISNPVNGLSNSSNEMPISEFLQQSSSLIASPYFDGLKASLEADSLIKNGLECLGLASSETLLASPCKQEASLVSAETELDRFLRGSVGGVPESTSVGESSEKSQCDNGGAAIVLEPMEGKSSLSPSGSGDAAFDEHFLLFGPMDVKPKVRTRVKKTPLLNSKPPSNQLTSAYLDDGLKWKPATSTPFRRPHERRKKLSTHEDEGVDLKCTFCGKVFANRGSMMRHKRDQHLEPHNTVVCDICGKVCKNKNCLITHRSVNHGAKQRPSQPFLETV